MSTLSLLSTSVRVFSMNLSSTEGAREALPFSGFSFVSFVNSRSGVWLLRIFRHLLGLHIQKEFEEKVKGARVRNDRCSKCSTR